MIHAEEGIYYLAEEEVREACASLDPVAITRETFRLHASGETTLPEEAYLPWKNALGEDLRSLNMPAYVGGSIDAAGTKLINGNVRNPQRGLPRADGITVLFDNDSGRIACVMHGAYLSSLRTASVTALAVDLLHAEPVRCVAIIGAGVLARAHFELLLKRLPQGVEIGLFDLCPERSAALQDSLSELARVHGATLCLAESAEEAIRAADLVIPVTTTTTGYIPLEWLRAGALLVNVSLDDPLPGVVMGAGKVFVDDWGLIRDDPRRLLGRMLRAGQVVGPDDLPAASGNARRIDGELGDIVMGKIPGRTDPDEVILMNPFGRAIEDVALASFVYHSAQQLGLGRCLPR